MKCTKASSVKQVLEIMSELEALFVSDKAYKNLLPFLYTYKLVTTTIYNNLSLFEDQNSLEKLDVYFANLYFLPLYRYLNTNAKKTPWKTYFDYCEKDKCIPIVSVLLGINAHVNSDLLTSIQLNKVNKHDYFLVNEILENLSDEVMRYLTVSEHDIFGLGGLFFKQFRVYEFRNTIQKWRDDVWQNKSKLKKISYFYQKFNYHKKTERNAKKIIEIFTDLSHFKNIISGIKELNSLKVSI